MEKAGTASVDASIVLVLDDDEEALEEIQEILELDDLVAVTASTANSALAKIEADPAIDLIVTDMHLADPGGDPTTGIDFIARVRTEFPDRTIRFIVLSGDASAITSSIETGAADFLIKPLMPEALLAAVRWASVSVDEGGSDPSRILMRKVEETTKSLQKVSVDLAAREKELSASQEAYERKRLQGAKLRQAMADGHVVPWFQPQICMNTRRVLGFEALARWIDPVLGPQSPAEFLPLAQEIGLMTELDSALQRQAMAALRGFHEAGLGGCDVGINLTAAQLAEPGFVDSICMETDRTGLEPEHVSIEVLESAMLDEAAADPIKENVNRLAGLGYRIELDDFGTGHAGLSSLRDLDVTRIKIDRSFVRDVHQDTKLQKFTRALIGLAKTLEIEVLAEGVETEAEFAWLAAEGCDSVQGFLIARPMPLEEILPWARAHDATLPGIRKAGAA
ncbi:MAG: EAL domain-containing protein [Pseudomonadota bacterium]